MRAFLLAAPLVDIQGTLKGFLRALLDLQASETENQETVRVGQLL